MHKGYHADAHGTILPEDQTFGTGRFGRETAALVGVGLLAQVVVYYPNGNAGNPGRGGLRALEVGM